MNEDSSINPTGEQRHEILRSVLERAGRAEDYGNIIRLLSPLPDILTYRRPGDMKGVRIGIIGGGLARACAPR